jgi:hypothetical protein
MTETALLIFGGVVSLIVFLGVIIYGMMSFGRWSERDTNA